MKDFEKAIHAVAEVMDLRPCQILCKRRFQETTDAKWMVVYLLKERGHYTARIAGWLGMTARNVNLVVYLMNERLEERKDLRSKLEEARKVFNQ